MLKCALFAVALFVAAEAFSQNAIQLGLVSKTYPLQLWDALASMKEEELSPDFRRLVLQLDHERSGNQHWCCHSGRQTQARVPVYNEKNVIVAWNTVPCAKVGCCEGYLEVAGHCLDQNGQGKVLDALDTIRDRMGSNDVNEFIGLLKQGSSLVGY